MNTLGEISKCLVQTYPVINSPMGGLLDPIAQWQRQMERELRSSADGLAIELIKTILIYRLRYLLAGT